MFISGWFDDVFVLSVDDCFFFFKQKTAYEMRISDWSSDVCSSDLARVGRLPAERMGSGLRHCRGSGGAAHIRPMPPGRDRNAARSQADRRAIAAHMA